MVNKLQLYSLQCDRCGKKLRKSGGALAASQDFSAVVAVAKEQGWILVDKMNLCSDCKAEAAKASRTA